MLFIRPVISKGQAENPTCVVINDLSAKNGQLITRVHADGAREFISALLQIITIIMKSCWRLLRFTYHPVTDSQSGLYKRSTDLFVLHCLSIHCQKCTGDVLQSMQLISTTPYLEVRRPAQYQMMATDSYRHYVGKYVIGFIVRDFPNPKTHPRSLRARYLWCNSPDV